MSGFFISKSTLNCLDFWGVSDLLYIKRYHIFRFVYIYKRAHCLSLMVVIAIFILYKNQLFAKFLYIYKKQKINPVYIRIFSKAQILRSLLSNKNVILHFWKKIDSSIAINCVQMY